MWYGWLSAAVGSVTFPLLFFFSMRLFSKELFVPGRVNLLEDVLIAHSVIVLPVLLLGIGIALELTFQLAVAVCATLYLLGGLYLQWSLVKSRLPFPKQQKALAVNVFMFPGGVLAVGLIAWNILPI